jgi:hypothetical protein
MAGTLLGQECAVLDVARSEIQIRTAVARLLKKFEPTRKTEVAGTELADHRNWRRQGVPRLIRRFFDRSTA